MISATPVLLLPLLLSLYLPTLVLPQVVWSDQRYTAPHPTMANRLDIEVETSTQYGLGVYRRPAEAAIIGGAAAARQDSERSMASPTLYEVMGGSLDGRTIDGLPINGKRLRNNKDFSSSSFRTTSYSPSLLGAGRLNSSFPWIPAQQTPYEYVQVTFPSATLVSHVSTRGGGSHGSWVTQYKISTSIDGVTWKYYSTTGEGPPKIFQGNNDISTVVRHQLLGKFEIYSVFGSGGRSQMKTSAPLLARMFRIYPVTWNSMLGKENKIALRFELLRRVECGDGFWDEMNEGCDDGNVISGDGCSGTSGDWRGTSGPCQPEIFATEYYDTNKAPQRHLDGVDSGHTVGKSRVPPHPKRLTQWCHPGSDCADCASQQVSSPTMKFEPATQEYYMDPSYREHCKGRRNREEVDGNVLPDRPPVADQGYTYRTTEKLANGPILYPDYPTMIKRL